MSRQRKQSQAALKSKVALEEVSCYTIEPSRFLRI